MESRYFTVSYYSEIPTPFRVLLVHWPVGHIMFFNVKEIIQVLIMCFLIRKNLIINSKYNACWMICFLNINMTTH